MSRSSDRRGRPPYPGTRPMGRRFDADLEPEFEPTMEAANTGEVYTGELEPPLMREPEDPPPGRAATQRPALTLEHGGYERAHARPPEPQLSAPKRATKDPGGPDKTAPIVPRLSVTGRSLTLVVAIMCCLACLTAGAWYLMNQRASDWLRDIASEVTVEVEPRDKAELERTIRAVVERIEKQPGIASVTPLSVEATAGLLEPWLGKSDAIVSLPVPRLIEVQVNPAASADLGQLRSVLSTQFKGVTLDDHRQWQRQIRAVTTSFALGGLAILLLVGAATTAVIVSATRSALASNREIVEVLHLVGATDRFIAREFDRHFLSLGIRSGVIGALMAAAVFLAMPVVMDALGGGSMSVAELKLMIGTGVLDAWGYGLLALVVGVIAVLCMVTSRVGVYTILKGPH